MLLVLSSSIIATNICPFKEELIDYCVRPKRTAAEVVGDFFSLQFPVEYLLDIIPTIKPRQFSISSSLKVPKFSATKPHLWS